MTERQPYVSSDFNWTDEERQAYIGGNYSQLAEEDARIDSALIDAIAERDGDTPLINQLNSVLELGVGGALRGPAFMAPLVHDHGIITITDISKKNVQATRNELHRVSAGDLGIWQPHQEHMANCHPAWRGAFGRAALLATYGTLSVSELEPDMADAVSLSYLIESKGHNDIDEWRRDLRVVARAAIRLIHIRQTDNSEAYMAGKKIHLAVSVTREQTEEELSRHGFEVIGSYTAAASGQARQDDDAHHYSGFSGILAERR
ncbi:hypothetical protein PV379_00865 [Streptomyces caniscabiei]|uniref:hypothetical protein n=1 Tax=Streptomyces caniscabiei TaxID=2746961 RepID=UPI00299FAF75|nr:hypothetical protein [Streptomyces caniscabiei]MDX2775906.1 hypothetical protein [Streptomyces caniscabiei]